MHANSRLPGVPRYENLDIRFEADDGALWFGMTHACFSRGLIRDMLSFQENLKMQLRAGAVRLRCLVFCSDCPELFSLGGDLQLFRSLIERKDRRTLPQCNLPIGT